MHPAAVRSDRPLHTTLPPIPPGSSILHQHHKTPNCVYIPAANLQHCASNLQNPVVYSAPQRTDNSFNFQDKNKWYMKGKHPRMHQQYCHQPQLVTYPKPLVIYDQQRATGPPPQPSPSFLVASSNYTQHVPHQNEHYNNSALSIIPQQYYKPPEVQTYCVLQERPLQRQQPQQQHNNSYYNINSVNNCGLQTTNSISNFQMPTASVYANIAPYASNPIPAVQSTSMFSTVSPVSIGELQRDPVPSSLTEFSNPTSSESKFEEASPRILMASRVDNVDWLPPKTSNNVLAGLFSSTKTTSMASNEDSAKKFKQNDMKSAEERYSDESSTSFEFTIEAEKMVSALCSTVSSHDLIGKDEEKSRQRDASVAFGDAGDDVSNKSNWFSEMYKGYENSPVSGKTVATQTQGISANKQQFPELIRKTAYWGCQEAEKILNSPRYFHDDKHTWLANISSATKMAITKSSTCFPVFAGDQIFIHDLINALVRISNGWLVLDNYLNKQHYPNLSHKYDHELVRCFQNWECNTHELLQNIIQTYLKLDETGVPSGTESKPGSCVTSFPGDVSMYTSYDIFEPTISILTKKKKHEKQNSQSYDTKLPNLQNIQYQNLGRVDQKDVKMRSRWTITESLNAGFDGSKSFLDITNDRSDSGISGNKFRMKGNSIPPTKGGSTKQTVSAEFCNLRNKILENSNGNNGLPWELRKKEVNFDNKIYNNSEPLPRIKILGADNYDSNQPNCLPVSSSIIHHPLAGQQNYFSKITTIPCQTQTYVNCKPYIESDTPNNTVNNYNRAAVFPDSVYVNRAPNQMEMTTIPRNRITLLSQIEPTLINDDRPAQEITANLSAWFASMESVNAAPNTVTNLETKVNEPFPRFSPHRSEMARSLMDLTRQLQLDGNRQLYSLQNMQSIQSAPWNANNLINGRVNARQSYGPDEYDSSEDVRVYMKPGSYNVPKKRHQRRLNRKHDSSSRHAQRHSNRDKLSMPRSTSSLPTPKASETTNEDSDLGMKNLSQGNLQTTSPANSLDETPRSLKTQDNQSSSQDCFEDLTWKNACASAEFLLETLTTNETSQHQDCNDEKSSKGSESLSSQKSSQRKRSKSYKQRSEYDCDASSYEASGDDSGKQTESGRLHHNDT